MKKDSKTINELSQKIETLEKTLALRRRKQ